MMQIEMAWLSAFNYFTPIVFDGIKRGNSMRDYLRAPAVKLLEGQRTTIKKEQLAELMDVIRQYAPTLCRESDIYEAIADHEVMIRKNGIRYSRDTALRYIRIVRKEPGMKQEDTGSQAYSIKKYHSQGKSRKEIRLLTGARADYILKITKNLAK